MIKLVTQFYSIKVKICKKFSLKNFAGWDDQLNRTLQRGNPKNLFINDNYKFDKEKCLLHASDYPLDFVKSFYPKVDANPPKVYLTDEERNFAQSYLLDNDLSEEESSIVGVHPGAGFPKKRWDWKRFAQVCDILAKKYKAKVLLLFGPCEHEIAHKIQQTTTEQLVTTQPSSVEDVIKAVKLVLTSTPERTSFLRKGHSFVQDSRYCESI